MGLDQGGYLVSACVGRRVPIGILTLTSWLLVSTCVYSWLLVAPCGYQWLAGGSFWAMRSLDLDKYKEGREGRHVTLFI